MTSASLDDYCLEKLDVLDERELRRTLKVTQNCSGNIVESGGQKFVSFASNDYLGLSQHSEVIDAAKAAAEDFGSGAGSSRLVSGNHPLCDQLEKKIARHKKARDCVLFGSGYLANIGTIPSLVDHRDVIFVDALSHACMISGSRLSQAQVMTFEHNNSDDLHKKLEVQRDQFRHCLIICESVYSMDGDIAPIGQFRTLANDYDSWLYVDDAHGFGLTIPQLETDKAQADILMGTLSKAIGNYGGYVCGSKALCDLLRNRARSFVFTTGLPPSVVAGSIAALNIIERDKSRSARPLNNAKLFCEELALVEPVSQIVPYIVGTAQDTISLSLELGSAGFFVPAIRPPTVPEGTSRLRISFTSEHNSAEILEFANILCGKHMNK